jgi:hypothetical protein
MVRHLFLQPQSGDISVENGLTRIQAPDQNYMKLSRLTTGAEKKKK